MDCKNCNGSGCKYCNWTGIQIDTLTIKKVNQQRVNLEEYKKQMKESSIDAKLCRDIYVNLKEGE